TTCATILTKAIFAEGCKSVAAGMNAMDLRRGISMAELEDPLILIHEKKISSISAVVKVLELSLKVCAVKAPGFGENRKANLQDLAILTGGSLITEELGLNLEKVELDLLGTCKKVRLGSCTPFLLLPQIRSAIELSTSDYDKEKLQERLAKLSGGVAVLKIGGASEAEVGEKKDRVNDALNATKAAVEEGIVPGNLYLMIFCISASLSNLSLSANDCNCFPFFAGGGVALLYASKELDNLQTANFDQKIGVQIIQNALKVLLTVHTIASNAGVEGAVVVGKLLEQDNLDIGYDAAKGEYVDMVKAGIIDPLKVIRTALVDAASVSSLMTTTESVIVELPKNEDAPAMGAGMGGMDY
ncbi:hypothetical protein BHM03_00018301, partial [Ensete ventricosum]